MVFCPACVSTFLSSNDTSHWVRAHPPPLWPHLHLITSAKTPLQLLLKWLHHGIQRGRSPALKTLAQTTFFLLAPSEKWLAKNLVTVFFKKQYLFNFRERGRKGEREGEKYHYVVATRVPCTEDLACNPGMCPGWEWNRRPFGSQASTQSTEQHQPGLNIFLKDFIYLFLKRWEGRENERERNIDWLPLVRHTTQASALTRN